MRAGSLFSGIGGLDLAVAAAFGAEPVWFCESDPHCRTVLRRHWPGVPVYLDIEDISERVAPVDLLHGGYPCQPFSLAGQQRGEDDERHLWPDFEHAIRVLRPRLVVLENVAGHLILGFSTVHADLAELGYDTSWGCVRAADAGAPHPRDRLFLVASNTRGVEVASRTRFLPLSDGAWDEKWGRYAAVIAQWESATGQPAPEPRDADGRTYPEFVEWMMGFPIGWTATAPRRHRLRMLGNAVVPQQGALALSLLAGALA